MYNRKKNLHHMRPRHQSWSAIANIIHFNIRNIFTHKVNVILYSGKHWQDKHW